MWEPTSLVRDGRPSLLRRHLPCTVAAIAVTLAASLAYGSAGSAVSSSTARPFVTAAADTDDHARSDRKSTEKSIEMVRIDLRRPSVEQVVHLVSQCAGKPTLTLVGDDAFYSICLIAAKPMSEAEAISVLTSALGSIGYMIVDDGPLVRIVAAAAPPAPPPPPPPPPPAPPSRRPVDEIPTPLTLDEVERMDNAAARAALATVSRARLRRDLDDATATRLTTEFGWLLERARTTQVRFDTRRPGPRANRP